MEVFLSELAEDKLKALLVYLLEECGLKVKSDFFAYFQSKIEQISSNPQSCVKSDELGGLYKCVVTRHTTFFYRVDFNEKEIEVITLFDTRQDPDKLYDELV